MRRDCSGAEKGSTLELDSTTVTPVIGAFLSATDQARSGTRSWKGTILGATSLLDRAFGTMARPGAAFDDGSIMFHFMVGAGGLSPSASINIANVKFGTNETITVRAIINAAGTAFTLECVGTNGVVSTSVLSFAGLALDSFQNVFLRWDINTAALATDTFKARVNGSAEQTSTAVNFATAGYSGFDFGILGQNDLVNLTPGLTCWIDDIILDDVNAAEQIKDASFLVFHEANGEGTTTSWTASAGTKTACVTDESDATFVRQNVNNGEQHFTLTDVGGGTWPAGSLSIPAVYLSVRSVDNPDTALQGDIANGFRLSGTNGTTSTITNTDVATTFRSVRVDATKPGGGAWTQADLDNVQARHVALIDALESVAISEAWAYSEIQIKIEIADPAALAESEPVITAKLDFPDALVLAEVPVERVTLSTDDALTFAESPQILNRFELADPIAFADALSIFVKVPLLDAIALADTVSQINVRADITDAMALGETPSIFVRFELADPLALAESPSILARVTLADPLTFADAGTVFARVALADPIAFAEGAPVIRAMLDITDAFTLVETPSITVDVDINDALLLLDVAARVRFIREDLCTGGTVIRRKKVIIYDRV